MYFVGQNPVSLEVLMGFLHLPKSSGKRNFLHSVQNHISEEKYGGVCFHKHSELENSNGYNITITERALEFARSLESK